MKYDPNESYEAWAKRVQMYEQGHAMKRIAAGEPADLVLEEMAKRITEKLIHPIIKQIESTVVSDYVPEKSKKDYEERYLKKNSPKPDHILDEKD
jgi:glutamyl-tRNA reductase